MKRLVTVALLGCLGLVGCGTAITGSSVSPRTELVQGLTALQNGTQLSVTVRTGVTTAELKALSTTAPTAHDLQLAQLVTTGSVTLAAATTNGKTFAQNQGTASTTAVNADLAVDTTGGTLLEVRVVSGTLYARVDTAKIASIAGGKTAASLRHLDASVPPSITWVHDALAGKWVSLSLAQAKGLASQLPGGAATPNPAQQQALVNKLRAILTNDTTVTRAGTSSAGDQLLVTGNVRRIGADALHALASLPGAGAALNKLPSGQLPNRTVSFTAWVKNGVLTKLTLDVAQFAPAKDKAKLTGRSLPIEVDVTQTAPAITAPSPATPIDLTQIFSLLGSLGQSSKL